MFGSYIKLGIAALLPVILSVIFFLADKKTKFGQIKPNLKQLIFGIAFGALAVVGTEWGIPLNGAQVNCRDAAVLTAGLLFGGPAGIIAGLIGGVERWIAVAWGVGSFTRVACSVSTVIAGIFAALLRKFMFEDKKPGRMICLAIGAVMEIFHLSMVFFTNLSDPIHAMSVVRVCAVPMVTANAVSVMLSSLVLSFFKGKDKQPKNEKKRISQTIQRWLLLTVVAAFLVTTGFVFILQTRIADTEADTLLQLALDEVAADVNDTSDRNLLAVTRKVATLIGSMPLDKIAEVYDVAEIDVIGPDGIITDCTDKSFIGYDMASQEQSEEFMCLLEGHTEYVQRYGPIGIDSTILRKYAGVAIENGFIQVGYDSKQFYGEVSEQVKTVIKNRHVGSTGFLLILNEDGGIVSMPVGFSLNALSTSFKIISNTPEGETFNVELNRETYFCRYRITEGYYIVSLLPETEAMQMRDTAMYVNTFMEILVFAALFALIYLLIKKVVVNRIMEINKSLGEITNGDLGVVVDVRSNAEFASLSDDINSTVDTLKRYIAEASARIDKELEFAKNIQSSALPSTFPAFPKRKDFDIFASMDPAKEVGGDFYDFYMTHDDTLNFLIADVSGKGIPAAMFMMRAKTELKSLTEADVPLCDVFTHGNEALCEGNDAGMFVTAWQGGIDLTTGHVQFANAGHNPPLVRHTDGKFEYLKSRAGFVLAGMDGVKYKTQELQLEPGDVIFLYTDGVTEATDAHNQLYGEERLQTALNSREFANVREMCEFVKKDVDAFVGEAPQFDDITMVALKYIGTPPAPSVSFENATLEDIAVVTEFVEAELEKLDCPMKTVMQMNIAIDEIFSNIVRYAYGKGSGPAKVEVLSDSETVSLRFTDEGTPYNPLTKEDPDVTLPAEERGIGGLGIFMVKKTMDDMKYEYTDEKNILTITKKL